MVKILTIEEYLSLRSNRKQPQAAGEAEEEVVRTSSSSSSLLYPVLDLREREGGDLLFPREVATAVVRIPLSQLRRRSYELPPRHRPFVVAVDGCGGDGSRSGSRSSSCLTTALQILTGDDGSGNHDETGEEASPSKRRRQRRQRLGWNVVGAIVVPRSSSSHENDGGDKKRMKKERDDGNDEKESFGSIGSDPCRQANIHRPLPRLWEPDRMVQNVLLPLLKSQLQRLRCRSRRDNTFLEIYDLGAGAGRDACFLAEELMSLERQNGMQQRQQRGTLFPLSPPPSRFRVVAVDQRYRGVHEREIRDFFRRRGVDGVADCRAVDMNDGNVLQNVFLESNDMTNDDNVDRALGVIKCLYAVRYCNVELLRELVRGVQQVDDYDKKNGGEKAEATARRPCSAVAAAEIGTIVAVCQFCKEEGKSWNFDHPKVRQN